MLHIYTLPLVKVYALLMHIPIIGSHCILYTMVYYTMVYSIPYSICLRTAGLQSLITMYLHPAYGYTASNRILCCLSCTSSVGRLIKYIYSV